MRPILTKTTHAKAQKTAQMALISPAQPEFKGKPRKPGSGV